MTYALTLSPLDGADSIAHLWREAEQFESEPSMRVLNYPPHLTLAIFDSIDPASLDRAARAVAADQPALTVTFDDIRYFDAEPMVLWAAPREADALRHLHACIFERLPIDICHPHYQPGNWVPHCTLAMAVVECRRSAAMAWTRSRRLALKVRFDALDILHIHPVEILNRILLADAADAH